MTQMTIIRLWQCLAELKRLTFRAQPGPESRTGWHGYGWGSVQVRRSGDDLWLHEQGRFQPVGRARILAFVNVYHWQRRADCLRLWHERFGRQKPVWLFDLWALRPDSVVSRRPHLCGDDTYAAQLRLTANGLDMHWRILGPGKDEWLHYQYG